MFIARCCLNLRASDYEIGANEFDLTQNNSVDLEEMKEEPQAFTNNITSKIGENELSLAPNTSFDLEEMEKKAQAFTDDQEVLAFIIKTLKDPIFIENPDKYIGRMQLRNTMGHFFAFSDALAFLNENFPSEQLL